MLTITDEEIAQMLRELRWPSGVKCPYCKSSNVKKNGRPKQRPYAQRYKCKDCGKQFNDFSMTPFSYLKLPPNEVLTIAYLYFKLGHSALAVAREVGRSEKAVRRVIKAFGERIESYFRLHEAIQLS